MIKRDWKSPGPVALAFLRSDALMCGIRGPFGSAKSTTCVVKLILNLNKQKPGPDGVARRRTAIIRNTYGELSTTTAKTWNEWVPREVGHWVDKAPPTHTIRTATQEWEVLFVALDRPEDLKKLLSMDLSDAWINEAREIPKAIVDGLTGRVGRFPRTVRDAQGKMIHTCAAPQIIMDSNPPDTDHWWAKMADFPDAEIEQRNIELTEQLRALGSLGPEQRLSEFFSQPSARSPGAENLANLRDGYYERLMADKTEDWIKVYVDGQYGFISEGKPVYSEYRDSIHARPFSLNPGLPIWIGIDFGLTPAAVIGQRTLVGQWRIHRELVSEDMGAMRFGEILKRVLQDEYRDFPIAGITGDPAGEQRAQTDERTPFDVLRAVGIEARPAPTNDFTKRREVFAAYLTKMIDGEPAMLVHPNCQKLRKALAGGYCLKRIQVSGSERYREVPDKDMNSHVAEAGQYMLLGAGEARTILRANPELHARRPQYAEYNYSPFRD